MPVMLPGAQAGDPGNDQPFPPFEKGPSSPVQAPGAKEGVRLPDDVDREFTYHPGQRTTPTAMSQAERDWHNKPKSLWEERKALGKVAARHLRGGETAGELDAKLQVKHATAGRKASKQVQQILLGTSLEEYVASPDQQASVESLAMAAAKPRRVDFAAQAPERRTPSLLELRRQGLLGADLRPALPSQQLPEGPREALKWVEVIQDKNLADVHPHFRSAVKAQGLQKGSTRPPRPAAERLARCQHEVHMGAEETRYAVVAAARHAQPAWHREAHRAAARCEAKPLQCSESASVTKTAAPGVALADGRYPMARADGRYRAAIAGGLAHDAAARMQDKLDPHAPKGTSV
jgi:hypothetical protein